MTTNLDGPPRVDDRVQLPDTAPCQYGTVLSVGRVLTDVLFDAPPRMWRERGLSDRCKYSHHRLTVVAPNTPTLCQSVHTVHARTVQCSLSNGHGGTFHLCRGTNTAWAS